MKLFDVIIDAVHKAEKEFGAGNGLCKKEQVISIVNAFVDIPVIPEFLEERIFSLVIDLVVYIFNKYEVFDKK